MRRPAIVECREHKSANGSASLDLPFSFVRDYLKPRHARGFLSLFAIIGCARKKAPPKRGRCTGCSRKEGFPQQDNSGRRG
jgi:hypothetical protein